MPDPLRLRKSIFVWREKKIEQNNSVTCLKAIGFKYTNRNNKKNIKLITVTVNIAGVVVVDLCFDQLDQSYL